jgi:hypothetical protein
MELNKSFMDNISGLIAHATQVCYNEINNPKSAFLTKKLQEAISDISEKSRRKIWNGNL